MLSSMAMDAAMALLAIDRFFVGSVSYACSLWEGEKWVICLKETARVDRVWSVTGSFRLAIALQDRINERQSISEVAGFLCELLPGLFNAEAVSIELPSQLLPSVFHGPGDFDLEGLTARRLLERRFEAPLGPGGTFTIRLWLPEKHTGLAPSDLAVMDQITGCFGRRLEAALSDKAVLDCLTRSELNVVKLANLPTDEMLARLGVSYDTLRTHLRHVYQKLGVRNRRAVVQIAGKAGIQYSDF